MPKALVIYSSRSGHTMKMAEAIAKGIEGARVSVTLTDVNMARVDDLASADAIVLGSPCYYGSMSAEMKRFLDDSVRFHGQLSGKVGGAFASSGMLGGGNETTVRSLIDALMIHGMVVKGNAGIGHFGPVSIGEPDEKALEECTAYGAEIAELTKRLFRS
ncbi:MAG: NAD(P)H-dependent oxidoreductase [Proteobacteria bacterium]|nr:NAD(P)H-dependent oxidoreductase [Pseudomonadota bacterium]